MALAFALLPTILLSLRVAAGPLVIDHSFVNLAISRRFNFTGTASLVERDLARIQAIQSHKSGIASRAVASEPINNQVVSYVASVGVGSPATTYRRIVDTGSSNTWVGANQTYVITSTSVNTTQPVAVSNGMLQRSGKFSGTEFMDTVTLADGLIILNQSIGVAANSTGFAGVDSILGLGPVDLTAGTVNNSPSTIPTVTDNLFSQGTIPYDIIGISFDPAISKDDDNGSIAFGGIDSIKFIGDIRISYGKTTILTNTSGLVDTGTTLIYIASTAFSKYRKATGATLDNTTGLLTVTASQYNALQDLNFLIGDVTYATPNAQIWPRSLNTAIGGSASSVYLIVGDLGTVSDQLGFINGYAFLERFYSVFDTTNNRVGFATTPSTIATTN
ncbi:aspartic peptidase domain-containing protein [Mycena maculata]|uniref:Aspartic peptidase domain-containing protein n=1 Tax=Mycena maculata TaxID=230809 RepID=A0AAD7J7N4_9AGAR|nr:aspartic peptidase domain-containing protein [Mycena maculata]